MREPVNTITHLSGVALSLIGFGIGLILSIQSGSVVKIIASIVFCMGLIGLYTASTLYHWLHVKESTLKILRKLDHSMIYILIAATYTPVCLITLKGWVGYTFISIIIGLTIAGIASKLLWLTAPRWIYTGFYLLLGWAALFIIMPIYRNLPTGGFVLLVLGGLSYSLGAVIYAAKPKFLNLGVFKFHEIFHLFILLGSIFHYLMMYIYVI